jgi:hypothetical protein
MSERNHGWEASFPSPILLRVRQTLEDQRQTFFPSLKVFAEKEVFDKHSFLV